MGEGNQEKSGKVAAHVFVRGRVQGVFFRMEAADEARRCGVAGWVRNLPDGRVEAIFYGDRPQVEALIQWCHHGPTVARVDSVEVSWEEPPGIYTDFSIC